MQTRKLTDPDNFLEVALLAAIKDPSTTMTFYRELLDAQVYVIPKTLPETQGEDVPDGTELTFNHIEFEGVRYMACYSSPKRMPVDANGRIPGHLIMDTRSLFGSVGGCGLVLNPEWDCAKIFSPEEVGDIADESVFAPKRNRTLGPEQSFTVGKPTKVPPAFAWAVMKICARRQGINRAWFVSFQLPGEDPMLIVVLDADTDDAYKSTLADVGAASRLSLQGIHLGCVRHEKGMWEDYFKTVKPDYLNCWIWSIWRWWDRRF